MTLLDAAMQAKKSAYPSVSGFSVGAAVRGKSGVIYCGANVEFAGLPIQFTLHAEVAALLAARRGGEEEVIELAVTEFPCGHCRQIISEWSPKVTITTKNGVGSITELLPNSFSLGNSSPFGVKVEHFSAICDGLDFWYRNAFVPYSSSPHAIALDTSVGIFYGATVDCGAYNPTVSAFTDCASQLFLKNPKAIVKRAFLKRAIHASFNELTELAVLRLWPDCEIIVA